MNKNNLFIALYAMTTRIYVDLVGRLMIAEIIALLYFPFINLTKLLKRYEGLKIVLSGLLVLLISQIISDFVNNSTPRDFFRGWGLIVFSIISTVYLVNYLSKTEKGIIYYLLSLFIIRLLFGEGDIDLDLWKENTNYFKSRFVGFLNPAVIISSYYFYKIKKRKIALLIFAFYALICIFLDARSNGLIFLITTTMLFFKSWHIKLSGTKIFAFGVLSVLMVYPGYIYYVDQVLYNGLGGTNARTQLMMTTNPYNPFELLYYGRIDFIVLLHAISDKPFWGFGSWGKDPNGYYANLATLITDGHGYNEPGYIRAHSIFLGTWVYAGILGFFASSFVFINLFLYFYKIYKSNVNLPLMPILVLISVEMFWSFLFSPLGHLRTSFPIFAAMIIVQQTKVTKNKSRHK